MKKFIFSIVFSCFLMLFSCTVYGQDSSMELYDFSEIEKIIDGNQYNIDFESTMKELSTGESEGVFLDLFKGLMNNLLAELIYNKEIIVRIILMAVSLALINNLSLVFKNSQISETGFFAIYCMIITVLVSGFVAMSEMVVSVLNILLDFMNALIPSLMLAMSFMGAYTSQGGFCQIILMGIAIVEKMMIIVILPAINIYVVLMLVNSLVNEDYISKFAGLISGFVSWFNKTIFAIFMGLNIVQTMILPSVDEVKLKGLQKVTGLVPGANAVGDVFLGTGNVIKNAIGTTALIVVVVIVAVPVVKVMAFSLMYKVTTAIIQPISDKRVVTAVDSVAKGADLLYKTVIFCAGLFCISIAIMCIATNNLG